MKRIYYAIKISSHVLPWLSYNDLVMILRHDLDKRSMYHDLP